MSGAFQDATSGAVGAVVSSLCTYPLDVAKTRLQAQRRDVNKDGSPRKLRRSVSSLSNKSNSSINDDWEAPRRAISGPIPYQGAVDCLLRIVREEGPLQLFVGLRPACVKSALTNFVYFYLLRVVRPMVGRFPLLQGICAGVGVQLIVFPIDMVVTRLQSVRRATSDSGFTKIVKDIIQRDGFFGLWAGIGPGLCLTLNPGITQMILAYLQKGERAVSAVKAFWSGAVAKAIAGTITYPYMRAKVQMQIRGILPGSQTAQSTPQILMSIIEESGVAALFDGLPPQLANGVLKEAILNMVRMKIAALVASSFLMVSRLRNK